MTRNLGNRGKERGGRGRGRRRGEERVEGVRMEEGVGKAKIK